MKFTSVIATAILGYSAAFAAPSKWDDADATTGTLTVTDAKIDISADNKVTDVTFKLADGDKHVSCTAQNPKLTYLSTAATACSDSKYLFNLIDSGLSSFEVAIMYSYGDLGSGEYSPGQWGVGNLFLNCKSNGSGRVCTASAPTTVYISEQ
ncbi:hypothetical protein BO86DRAFT_399094 [Aspergillus japonicus CBS 114.51]|uniref:AA1-like domain-containing protein n=2 Tax=Aspergillus TaxID=5052 RepID=A0A2V5H1S1_ASPV1|nr:hypothetical protein BO86DRAFT_399094 [Aspergillus japonicus CBS 114.51]PYI17521.1 hypothetical protein BO99DRAFT_414165 [Aspergillus violaceofuscus CBS 115571]RAH82455.1 hypothetical protein BO86DRAFT_399094 [Aspergillus japonicus CBS 114.51]